MFEDEEITQQADANILDDDFSVEPQEEESLRTPIPQSREVYHAASLVERFGSAFIDLMVVYSLYWIVAFTFRGIAFSNPASSIPTWGLNAIILNGLFFLLILIYFCVMEFTFTATIGKLICSVRIRTKRGEAPSFTAVLFRNFFKIIDLILLPLLVTGLLFEKLPLRQRLGDLITRTVVVKKETTAKKIYAPTEQNLASASGRTAAFLIDFFVFACGSCGLILMLSLDKAFISQLIFVFLPVAMIMMLVIPEAVFGTTLGKFIFGYTVCREDGTKLNFAGALIRNISRMADLNPFGYLSLIMSNRKQRLGDCAANTLVIKDKRKFFPLVGNIVFAIILLLIFLTGLKNPDNFLERGFFRNYIPVFSSTGQKIELEKSTLANKIYISDFSFISIAGSDVERQPIYDSGEEVFFTVEVTNFETSNDETFLREDLIITYPNGEEMSVENFQEIKQKITDSKLLKIENNIKLSLNSPPGRYIVIIKLRDMIKGDETQTQRYFFVTSQSKDSLSMPETTPSAPLSEPEEERGLKREDFPNFLGPGNESE